MIDIELRLADKLKIINADAIQLEQIMMNLGNPEEAFSISMIPNHGVGLARMEFNINSYIKVHPMALAHPERVKDNTVKKKIDELTSMNLVLMGCMDKGFIRRHRKR